MEWTNHLCVVPSESLSGFLTSTSTHSLHQSKKRQSVHYSCSACTTTYKSFPKVKCCKCLVKRVATLNRIQTIVLLPFMYNRLTALIEGSNSSFDCTIIFKNYSDSSCLFPFRENERLAAVCLCLCGNFRCNLPYSKYIFKMYKKYFHIKMCNLNRKVDIPVKKENKLNSLISLLYRFYKR